MLSMDDSRILLQKRVAIRGQLERQIPRSIVYRHHLQELIPEAKGLLFSDQATVFFWNFLRMDSGHQKFIVMRTEAVQKLREFWNDPHFRPMLNYQQVECMLKNTNYIIRLSTTHPFFFVVSWKIAGKIIHHRFLKNNPIPTPVYQYTQTSLNS